MKHYKNPETSEIFGYEDDGSQDYLIPSTYVAVSLTAPITPTKTISREVFCVALIGAGILTEGEAESAALGDWPAKFDGALAGKSLVEQLTIKNQWRNEIRVVPRDAPLFVDLLAFYKVENNMTDAQAAALADAIFAAT